MGGISTDDMMTGGMGGGVSKMAQKRITSFMYSPYRIGWAAGWVVWKSKSNQKLNLKVKLEVLVELSNN